MATHTRLLPPITAARLTWALTGNFMSDTYSQLTAQRADATLQELKKQAANDPQESEYIIGATASIYATVRSLDLVYKGRQLSFHENDKIRETHLANYQDNLEFGKKAQDILKSLPAMVVAGAGGLTVGQALGLTPLQLWAVGLGLAAVGYGAYRLVLVGVRANMRLAYVRADYERSVLYDQYISRTTQVLAALYNELNWIHQTAFGAPYPEAEDDRLISQMLAGTRPTFCSRITQCMRAGRVTPEQWLLCETGGARGDGSDCRHLSAAR